MKIQFDGNQPYQSDALDGMNFRWRWKPARARLTVTCHCPDGKFGQQPADQLLCDLPETFGRDLPSIEEIEAELAGDLSGQDGPR